MAASWTGPIDRTLDGLPFFTTLGRPDLICGAGYSGNGVGPSVIGGRILASLALGLDDEWSRCGLVRSPPRGIPPEPARYIGGTVVRGAVARKERAEDDGRPVASSTGRWPGWLPPGWCRWTDRGRSAPSRRSRRLGSSGVQARRWCAFRCPGGVEVRSAL